MEFIPNDAPCDEGYWRALLEEGEHSYRAAPPADAEDIWLGVGVGDIDIMEESVPPPGSLPSNEGWDAALRAMEGAVVLDLPIVGCNRGGLLVEWEGRQGFVPISHLVGLSPNLDEQQRKQKLQAKVGQVLQLRVIEVDPERARLVLSERATHSSEARRQELLESLLPHEIRRGCVTNLCSFGAFVDLGGLEGLVHISEVSWCRVDSPAEVLHPGQEVEVYVLNVDRERGRVGLSIKRARPDPWQTVEEHYYVDQLVEGVITNVVDFGAFVRVEEGLEGLVHVSELAEGNFFHPRNVVQEGQRVRLRVISVDGVRRRLGLSMRRVAQFSDQEGEVGG